MAILGGGYTGLWTAWSILAAAPEARVVLLEGNVCGHGPSGRNGGFCESYWRAAPALRAAFGDEAARRLADASSDSVSAIGRWCAEQGVDAWFEQRGSMLVATGPRQESRVDEIVAAAQALGAPDRVRRLTASEVQARCFSTAFGRGLLVPDFATVQPARLALGLRSRLLGAGAVVYERSPVTRLAAFPGGDVRVECLGGSVRARSCVVAIGAAARGWPEAAPRVAVASSHIVATEPVPDVLDQLGWRGGESITDGATLVHYFRPTRDGRIVFGWAGGRFPVGARLHGRIEVDPETIATVRRDLVRFFPQLAARRVSHAWGGPIDVSPTNLPQVDSVGPVHFAFGYTGNGVGPSHLVGRVLADLALGRRSELTRLPMVGSRAADVPAEPLAWLGGSLVRAALDHIDRRDAAGRQPARAALAVAALPRLLGIRLGR